MQEPGTSPTFSEKWHRKFADATRGLRFALANEISFSVHVPTALVVVLVATWLRVSLIEWLVLVLCISSVFAAECFNTSIERLARVVTAEEHPEVRNSLDVAAAAVLVVSIGAKIVWVAVLGSRAADLFT